jgi:hypothetical protein
MSVPGNTHRGGVFDPHRQPPAPETVGVRMSELLTRP